MTFLRSSAVKQSLRLLHHELRRGELTIVFLAIVLAVATVFSLTGFSSQIKSALISQSSRFIAADRVLTSSSPIDGAIIARSKMLKLQFAQQIVMSSMVFFNQRMQLVSLTAVSQLYPLRGELLVKMSPNADDKSVTVHAPQRGEVWLEKKVLSTLKIQLGDQLEIGIRSFTIAGIIQQIPDASFSVFNFGPKVILNIDDLKSTELIQPASRVKYKYLFAGNINHIQQFENWLKPQINETQRWYGIQSRQNALAKTLNRAEKYLSLASMLGIILAAVAVAVASRRYSQRHQPTVAVFKAMGASSSYVKTLFLLHWSLLSTFSILIGIVCGYLIQYFGLIAMAAYLPNTGAASLFYPLSISIITGLLCAIAFAIVPLTQLINTSPLAVIRMNVFTPLKLLSWQHLPAFFALFALLLIFSRDWQLSLAILLGGLLVVLILMILARLVMNVGRSVGSHAGQALQLAIANLKRRASQNSVQLVSFTIAIQLLLLLLVVRNDLLADWQAQLPKNSANRFLLNISAHQVNAVHEFVKKHQLHASKLYPVVPGRLTAINREKIMSEANEDKSNAMIKTPSRHGIGRELNLTWQQQLPTQNKLVAGQWWQPSDHNAQVSVEQSLAKRLNISIGDQLTFQLGSDIFNVEVTSLRTVNWQSMQPNFYMIFNAAVLKNFPATYITSLFISTENESVFSQFLAQYPTISMLDIDAMITQLRQVITQVSVAIAFILVLVILAGSLVLVAQVQASMEERQRDLAILYTLGAKGALLRNSILYEFIALGAIAGLLASFVMEITVYILQTQVFDMNASFHGQFWLLGIIAGGLFVGLIGMLSCRQLLTKTALYQFH